MRAATRRRYAALLRGCSHGWRCLKTPGFASLVVLHLLLLLFSLSSSCNSHAIWFSALISSSSQPASCNSARQVLSEPHLISKWHWLQIVINPRFLQLVLRPSSGPRVPPQQYPLFILLLLFLGVDFPFHAFLTKGTVTPNHGLFIRTSTPAAFCFLPLNERCEEQLRCGCPSHRSDHSSQCGCWFLVVVDRASRLSVVGPLRGAAVRHRNRFECAATRPGTDSSAPLRGSGPIRVRRYAARGRLEQALRAK